MGRRGPDRTAKTWIEVLKRFPLLDVVSSDQGKGLVAAILFLGLLLSGDPFHAFRELKRCLRALERSAYQRIAEEYKSKGVLDRRQRQGLPCKRARRCYQEARRVASKAIERFDRAWPARSLIEGSIALFDKQGRWLSYATSSEQIAQGLALLDKVEAPRRKSVANACDPKRLLNFKARLECNLECGEEFCGLSAGELIEIARATTAPCRTEPLAKLHSLLLQEMDRRLTAECPTWPRNRARILDEIEMPFRSESLAESVNSRLRVDQQALKHIGGILSLWVVAHNATPFRGGKRKGRSPLEILGIPMPPGTWLDWFEPLT